MKFRLTKIGLLAGPAMALAGIVVIAYFVWSRQGVLWNQVVFAGPAASLSLQDKQAIRQLILNQNEIAHPTHFMDRYVVTIDQETAAGDGQATWWSGHVIANSPYLPDGLISVVKQDTGWQIAFWGKTG